ncbi:MAG TPA: GNAT family N-acetyltransferase [Gemmatimonadales bacterium]|nr:GNAT family N-acetyltransferase [Gemmatimonadales bacterium]
MSPLREGLRRAVLGLDEWFIVPTLRSPRPAAWVAGRDLLAAPLQLRGRLQYHEAEIGGAPVRIACVGRPKRFAGLLRRWCDAPPAPPGRAGETVHSLWSPGRLATLEADLVAVEIHRWAATRFRRAGWAVVPQTVRWQADAAAVPPARPSVSLKSDLARVRRGGFTLEATRDPAAWRLFVDRMLRPTAEGRFGAGAWHPTAALLDRVMRDGELYFLCREGERLAGITALALGRTTRWFPLSGLRDGDASLLRDGVMAATYALVFARARAEGYSRLDLGRTTAFVHDGVAQVKRKWGFAPVRDPLTQLVALRLDAGSAALREVLARDPLLADTGEGLAPLTLAGAAAAPASAAVRPAGVT